MPATSADFPRSETKTILVVDDHDSVRAMLELALRMHGFVVQAFGNGAEACAFFTKHHERVHVMLLDVEMPEMDGPATFNGLRAIATIPCYFMTAGNQYTRQELEQLGALGVFEKPFRDFDAVVQALFDAAEVDTTAHHGAHRIATGETHFDKHPSKTLIDD